MEPLHDELLTADIPCAVYFHGDEYRRWASGAPSAPAYPTHILRDMDGVEGALYGDVELIVNGTYIDPVPERFAVADIEFTADTPGYYYGSAESVSTGDAQGQAALNGRVVAATGIRLASRSEYRFGVWTPPEGVITSGMYYASDRNTERRAYTEGDIVLDDYASKVFVYQGLTGKPVYTYTVPYDPFPYWNPEVELPEVILAAAGKLDGHDISFLVYDTPVYTGTGDMETHALLALAELGTVMRLVDMAMVQSWRAVPGHLLNTDSYPVDDPEIRWVLSTADTYTKRTYIVTEILRKAGWL